MIENSTETAASMEFQRQRPRLVSRARGWLGNLEDAQDAVQDTWLRMACALPGALPRTPEETQAWLMTVLRHVCIDRLRRRSLESRYLEASRQNPGGKTGEPSAEDLASLAERALSVLRLLATSLTRADAAGLLLQAVFDFRHDEVGDLVGADAAAQRQRMHRAMTLVRKRIGEQPAHGLERPAGDAGTDESHADEAFARLCLMAVRQVQAAPLIEYLGRHAPPQAVLRQCLDLYKAADFPPPFEVGVVSDSGRFALVWKLDGVVSCVVPLGELQSSDRHEYEFVCD